MLNITVCLKYYVDLEYHMMFSMPALSIIMLYVPSRMVYFLCVFLLSIVLVKLLIFCRLTDFVDSPIYILPKYNSTLKCTCSTVVLYVIYVQNIVNAIQQSCQIRYRGTVLMVYLYTIFYHASNIIHPKCAYKIIKSLYIIYVT